MSFPAPMDYRLAIQNPAGSLGLPWLTTWEAAEDNLGLPLSWAGAYAVVFKLQEPGGPNLRAVRCLTQHIPDLQARYRAYEAFYAAAPYDLKACLLPARYHQQGIRLSPTAGTAWWPVVEMDWSPAKSFPFWVASQAGNRAQLQQLQAQLKALSRRMAQVGMVHGDLQHGNLLVGSQGPILIDYDSMQVPASRHLRAVSGGIPSFRHPLQTPSTDAIHHDRFAFLLFHLGLEALVYLPSLAQRFGAIEGFLFTGADLKSHGRSELFTTLLAHPALKAMTTAFLEVCRRPADQVPDLTSFLNCVQGAGKRTAPPSLTPWTEAALDTLNRMFDTKPQQAPEFTATTAQQPLLSQPVLQSTGQQGSPLLPSTSVSHFPWRKAAGLCAAALTLAGLVWGIAQLTPPQGLEEHPRLHSVRNEVARISMEGEKEAEALVETLDKELITLADHPSELLLYTLTHDGSLEAVTVSQRCHDLVTTREQARLNLAAYPLLVTQVDAILRGKGVTPEQAIQALLALPGLPRSVRENLEPSPHLKASK